MHQPGPQRPDDPISREREQLATMLALMLLITFGGAFVLFLIFVSLGLFFWVMVMGAAIAAYAGVHYLFWGGDQTVPATKKTNQTLHRLRRIGQGI